MTRVAIALVILAAVGSTPARAAQQADALTVPTFGRIAVYRPSGPPRSVVLFVSGDGGWNLGVVPMAQRLQGLGALVVGIDIRAFVRSLEASRNCAYPAGTLEELARATQLHYKVAAYMRPVLVGYSSGATLVYAALAAAPAETFAGAISLGFCPTLEMHAAPCQMRGLRATRLPRGPGFDLAPFRGLKVPWMVLQGEIDQVCAPATTRAFVASTGSARVFSLPGVGHGFAVPRNWEPQFIDAYRTVVSAPTVDESRGSASAVADLPLVEVPAAATARRGTLAILLTGDGGWAEIDKAIASRLAGAGVPTVGWNSLRYYWRARTPDRAAGDLERIITHYARAWGAPDVLLIGYSFGADVLPFLVTRLPPETRAHVRAVTLLGPSRAASFEFHVAEWFGGVRGRQYETVPEIDRIGVPVTCVQGAAEVDSPCRVVKAANLAVASVGAGHHFDGDYDRLARIILRRE